VKNLAINLSLFKIGWLASVLTAAATIPAAGVAVVATVAMVHLFRAEDAPAEAQVLLFAGLVGLGWESVLVTFGLVEYLAASPVPGIAPYWIVAMWVLFATTLNTGMRWLRKSTAVAALAGAIGGPLSFLAGNKAGAVSFPNTTISLLIIGLGWAFLLPLLVRFAVRSEAAETQAA
jgi:hypothetical protein